jgi:hypothetical protein
VVVVVVVEVAEKRRANVAPRATLQLVAEH